MRHWNVIAGTLHSGDVFLPLLLEDESGISHANDWAKGFLRGTELRRTDWAVLLDDENQGGCLVPIFVLAHENDPDPEMRPYKRAISAEEREKLIVGAAAGVTGIYRYFEAQISHGLRLDPPTQISVELLEKRRKMRQAWLATQLTQPKMFTISPRRQPAKRPTASSER